MVTNADGTPFNGADVAAQFARAHPVDDLWREVPDVLPKEAMDEHVEGKPQHEVLVEEIKMSENKSKGETSFAGRTHDEARCMVQKALTSMRKTG